MAMLRRALVRAPLALLLLAGCGGNPATNPSGGSLALARAGTASAAVGRLVGGPGMASVAAFSAHLPAELGGGLLGLQSSRSAVGLESLARMLLGTLPGPTRPSVQVIRPSVLGHTYVYDAVAHRYVVDPSRGGAPANGVRFILYAVDSATHEPLPGQETGYAELTDAGAAEGLGVGLHLQAVSGGRTFLDYAFSLAPTFTGAALRLTGFLADEANRLDFTIGATAQGDDVSQSAHLSFDFAVPTQQFHATGTVEAAAWSTQAVRVDVTVGIGSDVIKLNGDASDAAVNAVLTVNGRVFATITGDPRHPIIHGEGGRELTPAESEVLGGLVGMVYGVLELIGHLLEPIAAILGLGTSL